MKAINNRATRRDLVRARIAEDGAVFAGNNVSRKGCVENISASTLRSMERAGLVTIRMSPDGRLMAVPREIPRAPQ